jgi:hypothetical protein
MAGACCNRFCNRRDRCGASYTRGVSRLYDRVMADVRPLTAGDLYDYTDSEETREGTRREVARRRSALELPAERGAGARGPCGPSRWTLTSYGP